MRRGLFSLLLLAAGVALCAYASASAYAVPGLLQYVTVADAQALEAPQEPQARQDGEGMAFGQPDAARADTALLSRIQSFEDLREGLAADTTAYALSGYAPQATVTAEGGTAAAGALYAVGEGYFTLYPRYLLRGRLLYPEELEQGARVALLDEQFALAVFRMADVTGREIELGGQTFRVVGVLRHARGVGQEAQQGVYVPLRAVAETACCQLQTLQLTAAPAPGSGAMTAFRSVATAWMPGGTLYDLRQERVGATIWPRFLLCALGFAAWGACARRFGRGVRRLGGRLRTRLREQYMTRLLPWFSVQVLLRALGVAALALTAAALFTALVQPVYTFPEYVPAVLVEPEEIAATFWKLQTQGSAQLMLRTEQSIRVAYFGGMSRWGVAFVLGGLACRPRRRRIPAARASA